jgi:hypothetical protein
MNLSLKKIWNDYGIGAILVLLIIAYSVSYFSGYLGSRGSPGYELNSQMQQQYKRPSSYGVQPASEGSNESPMSVNGIQSNQKSITNPAELLPRDTNSQWAQLNPAGKGELANMNLLKAGYHIGIDTVGQTLRNANLQLRSEPANPRGNTGPWLQSTIEPDLLRPALEIGSGPQ